MNPWQESAGMVIRKSDDCAFDSDMFETKKMQGEIVTREKAKKKVLLWPRGSKPKEKEEKKTEGLDRS